MKTLEQRDAIAASNRRRAISCDRCGANWTLFRVLGFDLPASLRAGVFDELRYNYCGACGNLRTLKAKR